MMSIFISFILVIILYVYVFYRYICSSKKDVNQAFQELDNDYKLRWDLVPSYLDYANINNIAEQDLVNQIYDIIKLNYDDIDADQKISINSSLTIDLNNLSIAYENYPILQKNKEFLNLNRQVSKSSATISQSIEHYNKKVSDFNELIDTFPMNIVAKAFKFEHLISLKTQAEKIN